MSRTVEMENAEGQPISLDSTSPEDLAYLAQREGLPGRELPADVKDAAGEENIRKVLEAEGGETPQMVLEHDPAPEETNPNTPSADDWYSDADTTKDDLINELSQRGLDVSGRKEELVTRLREDDASKQTT